MPDLSKLNEAQRNAVTWGEGPLLVLAGPGSGKTTVVVNRILYLLERGVPPESILVITFTRDAAQSMQQRFRMHSDKTQPVVFGTFHSVFYQILRESGDVHQRSLLSESQKKQIMTALLKQYDARADASCAARHETTSGMQTAGDVAGQEGAGFRDSLAEEAEKLLCAVSLYKNTGEIGRAEKMAPSGRREIFQKILRDYREAVQRAGALDFDDMIYECGRLLQEREEVRKRWQKRFSHILIDEFQDCNPMQYETLKLLSGEPHSIFAVGDDDQSIYGFRGACPEILRRFAEEFPAEQILLNINYRSRDRIVRNSLAVIQENKNRFPKELKAAECGTAECETAECGTAEYETAKCGTAECKTAECGTAECKAVECRAAEERAAGKGIAEEGSAREEEDAECLRILAFEKREEQYAYLCEQMRIWHERHGADGKRCALLFRTNSYMQGMAVRLRSAGIPFVMKEKGKSIYEHFIVKDIMAYLLLAAGEWRREHMLRVLNKPARFVSREAVGDGRSIGEMIAWYSTGAGFGTNSGAGCRRAVEALEEMERRMKYLGSLSPALAVNYVLKGMHYDTCLQNAAGRNPEKMAEWGELLEWLKEDAGRFTDVRAWRRAQEEYTEKMQEKGNSKRQEPEEGAIRLMSIHGSKGLEFDRVLVPDCNEQVFPHGHLPDEETVEEERRIFYVAMTRAKESLELLYLTGDKVRPRLPSRFLNPLIHSSSSSISSSNSQLSRYSSKASATCSYSASSSI